MKTPIGNFLSLQGWGRSPLPNMRGRSGLPKDPRDRGPPLPHPSFLQVLRSPWEPVLPGRLRGPSALGPLGVMRVREATSPSLRWTEPPPGSRWPVLSSGQRPHRTSFSGSPGPPGEQRLRLGVGGLPGRRGGPFPGRLDLDGNQGTTAFLSAVHVSSARWALGDPREKDGGWGRLVEGEEGAPARPPLSHAHTRSWHSPHVRAS